MIAGIVHWRDDVKDMSFVDFFEFHKSFFEDEVEAKAYYKQVTGNDPEPPKKKKKTESEG
jgi:hypothetical protein